MTAEVGALLCYPQKKGREEGTRSPQLPTPQEHSRSACPDFSPQPQPEQPWLGLLSINDHTQQVLNYLEVPFYLPWAGICCLPPLFPHMKDRRQQVHSSWGRTEAISHTRVAKGHTLIFPSCLWPTLLQWFGSYLATTLWTTQLLGVPCLLFCWEKAEKQQRYQQRYSTILHWPLLERLFP